MDDSERTKVLDSVNLTVSSYLVHWHRLSVDAALVIITGIITISGFAFSRPNRSDAGTVLICGVILFLTIIGFVGMSIIAKQVTLLCNINQSIDEARGLFEVGKYIEGKTIYPLEWNVKISSEWHDPIFKLLRIILVMVPLILCIGIIVQNSFF